MTVRAYDDNLAAHVAIMARNVVAGRVVFVIGSEAAGGLPRLDLARRLAKWFDYPEGYPIDLERVAQWAELVAGRRAQYEVRRILAEDHVASGVERLVASLARPGQDRPHHVVMTTSYQAGLEQSFDEAGVPYDLVTLASDRGRVRFAQIIRGDIARVITAPNEFTGLDAEERSVIVKLRVKAEADDPKETAFILSEDDVAWLSEIDLAALLPLGLRTALAERSILLLGFRIGDRVERLFVRRLLGRGRLRAWAVSSQMDRIEERHWQALGVDVVAAAVDEYVAQLERAIGESESAG